MFMSCSYLNTQTKSIYINGFNKELGTCEWFQLKAQPFQPRIKTRLQRDVLAAEV